MQACDTPLDWAKREKQHEIVRLLNNAPYIRMEVYAIVSTVTVSIAPYIRMEVYAAIVSIAPYIRMEVELYARAYSK